MSMNSIAGRATVAGTAARAMASVFATASKGGRLRELGLYNTTTNALAAGLIRFTNATNVGAALTEAQWDSALDPVPTLTGYAGHTGDGGTGGVLRQGTIGAAAGAGIVWCFGGSGITIPVGAANGVGPHCPTGTGQICDYYMDWEE
jgi:hypothetical protein